MGRQTKQDLPLQVLKKFRVIYGSVRQHFRDVEASCGLSGSQLWILREIDRTPGVGVSELATRLSVHQSTSSQLVEKLVLRGLVSKQRSREDQRRVGLLVSREARELIARAPGPAKGILPEALMAMSASALVALDGGLEKVIEQLEVRDERYADRHLSEL